MSQHLKLPRGSERQQEDMPRSEPDSGNPTVRDRRGACGNVGNGSVPSPSRATALSRLAYALERALMAQYPGILVAAGALLALR